MIDKNLSQIPMKDINTLIDMGTKREVMQYFGDNCKIIEGSSDEEFHISGKFSDGFTEGGQSFSLNLNLTYSNVNAISVWGMSNITVNGVDVSSSLSAPVLIPRRLKNKSEKSDTLTILEAWDQTYSFAIPDDKRPEYYISEFSTMDNLIVLMHEDGHIKVKEEASEADRLNMIAYKTMITQLETSKSQEEFDEVIANLYSGSQMSSLRSGSRALLINEVAASQSAIDFLCRNSRANWFNVDTEFHRVINLLTSAAITYLNLSNRIFGPKSVDQSIINFRTI